MSQETPNRTGKQGDGVEEEVTTTPHTPIHTLHQVGRVLQIPDDELTEDKLDAGPDGEVSKNGSDV